MNITTRLKKTASIAVAAALFGTMVTGVVPAAGAAERVASERTAAVAPASHEYKVVYTTPSEHGTLALPALPAGVVYTRVGLDRNPDGRPDGLALGSDGILRSVGAKGEELVQRIAKQTGGALIRDFAPGMFSLGRFGLSTGGVILFDGTYRFIDQEGRSDLPVETPPSNVLYTRFLDSPWLAQAKDGRIVAFGLPRAETDGPYRSAITTRADYVAGGDSSITGAPPERYSMLLRKGGTVDLFDPRGYKDPDAEFHGASKGAYKSLEIPRLPKGMKYLGVVPGGDCTVYLRSDDSIIYAGLCERFNFKPRAPRPPAGLHYIGLQKPTWRTYTLLRSDGEVVALDTAEKWVGNKPYPESKPLPKLAKGWRSISTGAIGAGYYLLAERIEQGEKVPAGISDVRITKCAKSGSAAWVRVSIAARASLEGGLVKISHHGKTVGKARVTKGSAVTVKVKTNKTMRSSKKLEVSVQYLGHGQAKRTAKTSVTLAACMGGK